MRHLGWGCFRLLPRLGSGLFLFLFLLLLGFGTGRVSRFSTSGWRRAAIEPTDRFHPNRRFLTAQHKNKSERRQMNGGDNPNVALEGTHADKLARLRADHADLGNSSLFKSIHHIDQLLDG